MTWSFLVIRWPPNWRVTDSKLTISMQRLHFLCKEKICMGSAAIAQWIYLRLPFAAPGSTPKSNLCYIFVLVMWEKNKNKQKRPGLAHLKKYERMSSSFQVKSFLFSIETDQPGVSVVNRFQSTASTRCWNKALWLDAAGHVTSLDQSKCFFSIE